MDALFIQGGTPLKGNVRISGAKNAALPLMCASLLSAGELRLSNVPKLADIATLGSVLSHLGTRVSGGDDGHTLTLTTLEITTTEAPYDMVRKMRASILVLGPLVARMGRARVSLPGGCAIGNRPIDLHLKGLEAMGAEITLAEGYVEAAAKEGLSGGRIVMPLVSVGATENLIMAASLARGETVIENAAREPEIADLANCLIAMGATIEGAGSSTIHIQGVEELSGADYSVMPDRIEAGSYAVAAVATGGEVTMEAADAASMGAVLDALTEAGAEVALASSDKNDKNDNITVSAAKNRPTPLNLRTAPYPGFPTDMQAQFMALLSLAEGASVLTETIFENRYMHVPELSRMGADITVSGSTATIRGCEHLRGAPVMATDLRASMSLVIAALAAEGESVINRIYHLDRGYERIEEKLTGLGAQIERRSV